MKVPILVLSTVGLIALTEVKAAQQGEAIIGFQCVGLNIKGLNISQEDLRTGAKFPWILEAPTDGAKPVGRASGIIFIAWPPVLEAGFLKAMTYGGKVGWIHEGAVKPLRRANGTTGGCTLTRRADGRIMFDVEPSLGINN